MVTNPGDLSSNVEAILQAYVKRGDHLAVGLSGGMDSVVLLDILAIVSRHLQFKLSAVHVNHGISPFATEWSHFCCDQCYLRGIPIHVGYLKVDHKPGVSLEAAARDKRYQIFSRIHADYLVLAQHLDDQAETLLLQLLRGAGARGLSAMPTIRRQSAGNAPLILRPMLGVSRSAIEAYAQHCELEWVHDESNHDSRFDRNFLRHEILPVLSKRYPGYAKTLQRTSQHMAEASQLLDELAEVDTKHCFDADRLYIPALRALSPARAKNLLRFYLRRYTIQLPSTAKLEEILRQLCHLKKDAQLHITLDDIEIRVFKNRIYLLSQHALHTKCTQHKWQGESYLQLPELGGVLFFATEKGRGLNASRLEQESVMIKIRAGGEHFTPDCKRPRRSLKKLLQEASIPPWERYMLPLLFCGEKLAWVPGIGIDCAFQVLPDEMGVIPTWQPDNLLAN